MLPATTISSISPASSAGDCQEMTQGDSDDKRKEGKTNDDEWIDQVRSTVQEGEYLLI